MEAKRKGGKTSEYNEFHFEYVLKYKKYELEGKKYIGIGILVKMIDFHGNEESECIQDITSLPEVAEKLINMLDEFKVSPMCLKIFIEDFIASN